MGNQVPGYAGVAHPVERHLAKVEVASSSLVARSNFLFFSGMYPLRDTVPVFILYTSIPFHLCQCRTEVFAFCGCVKG